MGVERLLNYLRELKEYKGQIEHVEEIPKKEPRYGMLEKPLPPPIKEYLERRNIRLYTHQAEAINLIREGKDVIITTPTASGKTLAFNIPVIEKIYYDPDATALYFYPTKALANDQLENLKETEKETGIEITSNIYDGDTPQHLRPKIRDVSRVIITNPYAMHQYLPWHQKWRRIFKNLSFVVIDEAHVYRGVFGSNFAFLLRRILRLCDYYGSDPLFILSSATIANPGDFSKKLVGKEFEIVSDDGSARGRKYFLFWNPPFIDLKKSVRASSHQETKKLFVSFINNKLQTLCFTVSRKMAELITRWAREELNEKGSYLARTIATYRAGYLPEERREIEKNFREGILAGVVSTIALEVGIDIGSLDAVIISGYPGTIISTWQQAGRSGRGLDDSIACLVAFENPLDQYFMKHPDKFFKGVHEHAIIDLENPYIVTGHLMCASAELPFQPDVSKKFFGDQTDEALLALEREGLVRKTPRGWVYSGVSRPVEVVNLNNISDNTVTVVCNGEVLETMDLTKAYNEAHKGAVLLHQGETYIVEALDLKNSLAKVRKEDVDYYTETLKISDIRINETIEEKDIGIILGIGDVEVTEYYQGFRLKKFDTVIGYKSLDLPPLTFESVGMWFTIPDEIRNKVESENLDFQGGIHAVEHAMIAITPFHVMCDRWDIGGVSSTNHIDTNKPTIFLYDAYEGGIGIAEKSYDIFIDIIKMTFELIRDCECEEGCPSCIYSPKCGNENRPLDKTAALIILEEIQSILDGKISN